MTIYYVDPLAATDAGAGTKADPWKTINHAVVAGDEVRVKKIPDSQKVNTGQLVAWTKAATSLTLNSALTKNVDLCESVTAWTASAGAAVSVDATYKRQGTNSIKCVISTAINGKILYKDLGATGIDFSSYTKLSFWIYVSAAVASGLLEVCLCSDQTGDTIVDEFMLSNVTTTGGGLDASNWHCIHIIKTGGGNLGSAIKSVAIYSTASSGTFTFYIDNIFACNNLHLNSVIGKNNGDGVWYPITSIDELTVSFGTNGQNGINNVKIYDATGSANLWYLWTDYLLTADNNAQASGTSASKIQYRGGWNFDATTDYGQDGETWWYHPRNKYMLYYSNNKGYVKAERFYGIGVGNVYLNGSNNYGVEAGDISVIDQGAFSSTSSFRLDNTLYAPNIIGKIVCVGKSSSLPGGLFGIASATIYNANISADIITVGGNANGIYSQISINGYGHKITGSLQAYMSVASMKGVSIIGGHHWINSIVCKDQNNEGLYCDANNVNINSLTTSGNSQSMKITDRCVDTRILSSSFSEATELYAPTNRYANIACEKYQGVAGRFKRYHAFGQHMDNATAGQDAYGGSGTSLYLNPTSYTATEFLPLIFYAPCTAGTAMQVHFQTKKTGGSPTLTLSASGCGITEISEASVTLTTSWAEYTSATMTPTETGFIRIELRALDANGASGDIGIDNIHAVNV